MVCRGVIEEVEWPKGDGTRVDTWITSGTFVSTSYDSLLAKVMVHSTSRSKAISTMSEAMSGMRVKGIATNAQLLQAVMRSTLFEDPKYDTTLLNHLHMEPSFVEVRFEFEFLHCPRQPISEATNSVEEPPCCWSSG